MMNKKILSRKVILSLIVLFIGIVFVRAEQHDCIIIHMKAGNKVFVPIKERPKITIETQMLSIGTEQYQISNVSKYTFGKYAQGLGSETVADNDVLASKDGHVYVQMKNERSTLKVFAVDGKVLEADIRVRDSVADIRRGVAPFNKREGLVTAVARYSSRISVSCSLITLFATCSAVVVFPHHLGPSISTAPNASRCSDKTVSAVRFK